MGANVMVTSDDEQQRILAPHRVEASPCPCNEMVGHGTQSDVRAIRPLVGTMGMFIIDTFAYLDPTTGADLGDRGRGEQVGGGGLYFAIGARMWLHPSQILMVVDRGTNWKQEWQQRLDEFTVTAPRCGSVVDMSRLSGHSMWHFRQRADAETTKAVNVYTGEQRGFDYITPRLRLEPRDLISATSGSLPEWVHCVCSPERLRAILSQIHEIDSARRATDPTSRRTRVCWEPMPDSCVPENLTDCIELMQDIDVMSPNHEEAAALLSVQLGESDARAPSTVQADGGTAQTSDLLKIEDEHLTRVRQDHKCRLALALRQQFHQHYGTKGQVISRCPIIVIRSGAAGSSAIFEAENGRAAAGDRTVIDADVPAYHGPQAASAVRDVTGGGNAFLGGLVAYLATHSSPNGNASGPVGDGDDAAEWLQQALITASVSASFVIEQLGLPELRCTGEGGERWNGEKAQERFDQLMRRTAPRGRQRPA
ncbi:unnamed protein product [Parajaminaea phylloscopi]